MPGYGIAPVASGGGLLPWSWAVERLATARNYWVATRTDDGRPHLAAVWGVWFEGVFYFSTGGRSRKAQNLFADPRCSFSPESAAEAVVVEGLAERVEDPVRLSAIHDDYARKYGSGFPDPSDSPVFGVRPRVAFGIIDHEPDFTDRATRWRFDPRD
jgi:general stress protein 26